MGRDTIYLAKFDLICKLDLVRRLKRSPQGQHLVDHAASRPDVTLFVVALLLDLLRAHVVRRADVSISED